MAQILRYLKEGIRAARDYNSLDFFPLPRSLAGYNTSKIPGDLRAGLNVALLAFPQGMAYALIAGLPIEYGIYGTAIAAMLATVFTRTQFISLGPTNATAVMLLSAFLGLGIVGPERLELLPTLILLIGLFILLGAYFKVATFIQYISRSVITGYITAGALLIITNQIPKALGLQLDGKGATFFESISQIMRAIDTVHWLTLGLSLVTAAIYLLLNRRFRALPNVSICLAIMSVASALLLGEESGVAFFPGIDATNWTFQTPSISYDTIKLLASPALAIALLCTLEGISIGKSLAARTGARLDTNQAMFSIGMANLGCAFFSGMPASGSLTRSALSTGSGGNTVLASYISGVIVFIGAFLLGPYVAYIPQCALAVLVIAIGVSLVNKHAIRVVMRTTKSDGAVFLITFGSGTILPLDTAIYVGVGTSIMLFLKKAARPEMVEYAFNDKGQLAQTSDTIKRDTPEVSIVHVEGELFFGAAELFRDQMRRICEDRNLKIVILKMRNAHNMDATAVMALEELVRYMEEMGRYLILSEVKRDLARVLKNSGLYDYLEERNIFRDDPANPTMSTALALRWAKKHLGAEDANVSIYVDPIKDQEKRKNN